MLLTITVSHDRDQSCNDYTLTRTVDIAKFNDLIVKAAVGQMIDLWRDSYPHRGRQPHSPVVDVIIDGMAAQYSADLVS
jgi:hypothetical protein